MEIEELNSEVEEPVVNVFDLFGTDKKMERSGIWLDYGTFRILVARAGGANNKFARTLEALSKPYRRALDNGTLPNEKGLEILVLAYARSIILGWEGRGLVNDSGEPLEYNEKNVVWLLSTLPDLFTDIQSQVNKMENFRQASREDDAKN